MELSAHATEILKGLKKVAQSSLDEAFTVPPAIYSDAEIAKLMETEMQQVESGPPSLLDSQLAKDVALWGPVIKSRNIVLE